MWVEIGLALALPMVVGFSKYWHDTFLQTVKSLIRKQTGILEELIITLRNDVTSFKAQADYLHKIRDLKHEILEDKIEGIENYLEKSLDGYIRSHRGAKRKELENFILATEEGMKNDD
jgi:hypothetical protein